MADDVDWDNKPSCLERMPLEWQFQRKSQLARFFQSRRDNLDLNVFNPHTFVESGNHVAVLLASKVASRRTARERKTTRSTFGHSTTRVR